MAHEPTQNSGLTAETPEPRAVTDAREVLAASKAATPSGDVDLARWWGRVEQALEILLAAIDQDDEGQGDEEPLAGGQDDDEECAAEFIDGVWTHDECGCIECRTRLAEDEDESDVPAPDEGEEGDDVARVAENLLILADRGPLVRRHADELRADCPDAAAALDIVAATHDRLRAALDNGGAVFAAVEDIRAASATAKQALRAAHADAQGDRP